MGGFLLVVVLVVALYNIFIQVFHGVKPSDFFRVNVGYIGPLASSTPQSPKVEVRAGEKTYQAQSPQVTSSQNQNNKPTIQPPYGFTVAQLSPFYKKIQISSLNPSRASNQPGSFELRPDWSTKETIPVSGWYLKVNSGNTVAIPRAVNDYPVSSVPQNTDIALASNMVLKVMGIAGKFGYNVRLNKCMGYLNDYYDGLNPRFPNSCPGISRNDILGFSGNCQSLLLSMPRCHAPTASEINQASTESACRSFLDTLSYGGCYNAHRSDGDFFSNEWWVWLGQIMPFDDQHDRVLLFDNKGLLVNEYVY